MELHSGQGMAVRHLPQKGQKRTSRSPGSGVRHPGQARALVFTAGGADGAAAGAEAAGAGPSARVSSPPRRTHASPGAEGGGGGAVTSTATGSGAYGFR